MSLQSGKNTRRSPGRSVRSGAGALLPVPSKPAPAKSRPRANLQLDKAVSTFHTFHAEVQQLTTLLEQAKDEMALNKFIHFDYPRTVKRLLELKGTLFRLLDDNGSFTLPFSVLFRHFNQMESSLERAQAGVGRLQFAAVRKDPWIQLKKTADRIASDLEHIRDSCKELERLFMKR